MTHCVVTCDMEFVVIVLLNLFIEMYSMHVVKSVLHTKLNYFCMQWGMCIVMFRSVICAVQNLCCMHIMQLFC